ncbi:PIG-L family deacetylase [uncultured Agrococcus sp.]|uniref:PIG-L deacetylase family protein n=1 Tax=uncultured Agrococcus sp. TaxID=382258 RepID=UPI0025E5B8A7|nr:PIG-L family deacetylase [uncultured Agrococcus sp.]
MIENGARLADLLSRRQPALRILAVHAHPDDEALCGGALLREFRERGAHVSLLTCSRGEAGEIVTRAVPTGTPAEQLPEIRERELRGAADALGIAEQLWLGTPPARAVGLPPRNYRDSGMRWIEEGLAGPADTHDEHSLTAASLHDVVADIDAAIAATEPELILSYDDRGGYGHPDHVRAREAALQTARNRGILFAEFTEERAADDVLWFSLPQHRDAVLAALRQHRTQLTVDRDGRGLTHSGGQWQTLPLDIGLRAVTG